MATDSSSPHGTVANLKKSTGATYTPRGLAAFVAQQVADLLCRRPAALGALRVLDPAVGDGELVVQLVTALRERGVTTFELLGFDVDAEALEVARRRLEALQGCSVRLVCADFLAESPQSWGLAHVVVANPPYVRTQVLGEQRAKAVARRHGLRGRLDLYQAFMVSIKDWVEPGAVVGLITSNRFLSVKAGADVRRHLWQSFRVEQVWDLGDTQLFDAAVLPAVTVMVHESRPAGHITRMTTMYSGGSADAERVTDVYAALNGVGHVGLPDGRSFLVEQGRVVTSEGGRGLWRLGNAEVDGWLDTVRQHTWKELGELGPVRVGIKSTADAVFLHDSTSDAIDVEPALLRPLTTHHIARRYRALPVRKQVLYPHEVVAGRRQAVDLTHYPKARAYLQSHRPRLEGRAYVINAKRQWYELWVPHDPERWHLPKLVFRDIVDEPQFWVDLSGSVVNGDCYWLAGPREDLLWLAAAVCNSRFIEQFYDRRFNNKLYAGRRRFLTQYVRHFPLPDPTRPESQQLIALAKRAYAGGGDDGVDVLVETAFGLRAPTARPS